MLPDMSNVLKRWATPQLIKTISITTVDFSPVETVTGRTRDCVVQVADKEKLNPDTVDWSLEYLTIHSAEDIKLDELVEFDGRDFIVTDRAPWFGYTEITAAETKRPIVLVTP
jgi:hypothetical protein